MKKKLLLASTVFMALSTTYAQEGVGIGKSILPDATAVLDVGATDKGILIPRVALTGEGDDKTIKGGAYPESLLVYNQGIAGNPFPKGFYFWSGGKWNALVSKTSTTTSEVLTTLEISADGEKVVLTYTGEDKQPVPIAVSDRLQKDPSFNTYIKSLVTSTAAGVELVAGDGITVVVVPPAAGETVTKYTISANPVGITLNGDVTGKGTETVVEKINGVNVAKPSDADFGLALVYDETTKTWKPGKPKIDNTSVTDKANLTVDSSLEFTTGTGTGALLSATGLKVKAGGITDTHLAVDAVKEGNIENSAVTETKIKDAAVTTGKIKGGTKGQVLVSGDNNATVWVDQTTIVPKVENVTVDGSLEMTGGTGAVLATTDLKVKAGGINDTHLAVDAVTETKILDAAVTETKIKDAAVTTGKIKGGTKGQVLVSGDNNATVWVDQTTIVPKVENVTVDGSLEITGGTGAVLATTDLKVKSGGITDTHLAVDAVTETKIKDAAVTTGKIKGGTKGQVLVSGDNNATVWVDQTTIVPKVENVTVDGSLEITGGTGAVLATTDLKVKAGGINDTHLAANAVTEAKIATNAVTETKILDAAVTTTKIKGGTKGQVLVSGDNNATVWVDQTTIVPKVENVTVDGSLEMTGGTGAVLATTDLKVKTGGIADTHLAVGAVTETKILDSAVTTLKIKDEAVTLGKLAKGAEADLVLTTGAGGVPTWIKKDLIATKKDLTTDGVIVIGDATSTVTSLVGAVMQPTTLSLKNNSVVVDKLATITAKNQHLVTDEAGKPKWESKAVNITSTATLLNEALDGKKVYSITIPAAAVVAPATNTGLGYNSEMTVPIAADFDYLLSVHIYKGKKLVMSSATDGTVSNGKLTFKFGGNGMYLTLPVAADYKVVLKYASNQDYVN